jgi:hypothetical protein
MAWGVLRLGWVLLVCVVWWRLLLIRGVGRLSGILVSVVWSLPIVLISYVLGRLGLRRRLTVVLRGVTVFRCDRAYGAP